MPTNWKLNLCHMPSIWKLSSVLMWLFWSKCAWKNHMFFVKQMCVSAISRLCHFIVLIKLILYFFFCWSVPHQVKKEFLQKPKKIQPKKPQSLSFLLFTRSLASWLSRHWICNVMGGMPIFCWFKSLCKSNTPAVEVCIRTVDWLQTVGKGVCQATLVCNAVVIQHSSICCS